MDEQSTDVVFLDQAGHVLARGVLPTDALIEGETDGSVKEVDIRAEVIAAGQLDHYLVTQPNGEVLRGRIIERKGSIARELIMERVDVTKGEYIFGKWQVKDK